MAGLGIAIWAALRAAVGIGTAVDNHQMKKESFGYTDKGEPTYLDRNCNRYINGEKVVMERVKRPDGFSDIRYVGQYSRKIYYDPQQAAKDRLDGWSEKYKSEAIAKGELAYMRYDHQRKKELTCEISTNKFIAALEGRDDGTYWKYYLSPNNDYCHCHMKTEGDTGVQITQEEYDKLNIYGGSHSACDFNRYTYVIRNGKAVYQKLSKPYVAKENLPKVPSRN